MRLQIAKILPLAFADTLRRICAERNDPEHLSTLYLRFGSILKQIREKRRLTIHGLLFYRVYLRNYWKELSRACFK